MRGLQNLFVKPKGMAVTLLADPRMIASFDRDLVPVYQGLAHQQGRRDEILSELATMALPYFEAQHADKVAVNRVLELERVKGELMRRRQQHHQPARYRRAVEVRRDPHAHARADGYVSRCAPDARSRVDDVEGINAGALGA
jgi:hypothetical protein